MIDWGKLYFKHIENCKNRVIEKGKIYHKHHIIPKSSGGNDDENNLIILTYKQHVFAHFLLYKWNPVNSNWIAYRLMSGIDENKKQAIEKLKIKRIKESLNNRNWSPEIIEERRKTMIKNIQNLSDEEFYLKFIEPMEGPNHPMYGVKRPGELAGNFGTSKGKYILIDPLNNKLEFKNIKSLIKWGLNELTIRNWVNKGKIIKNPKCNKPFKWEGFEIIFESNPNYGKVHEKSKNRKRKLIKLK
jgi:hypothetical protein